MLSRMTYDPAMPDWPAPAPGADIPTSRTMAVARLAFGWIAAQSLLTLIPIAPPWGVAGLSAAGAVFVAVALSGGARLVGGGLSLAADGEGLRLAGVPLAWEEVRDWRLADGPRRLEIRLAPEAAARMPWRVRLATLRAVPARVTWRAGDLTATLAEAAAALRAIRPDLEA